jgi:hypothetical protein
LLLLTAAGFAAVTGAAAIAAAIMSTGGKLGRLDVPALEGRWRRIGTAAFGVGCLLVAVLLIWPADFRVVHLSLMSNHPRWGDAGPCPARISFTGSIEAEGGGTVSYTIQVLDADQHSLGTSKPQKVRFSRSGFALINKSTSRDVGYTFRLTRSQIPTEKGGPYAVIDVGSPRVAAKIRTESVAPYSFTCAPQGQIVSPSSGETVGPDIVARGRLANIPQGRHVWVFVRDMNLLYPQGREVRPTEGGWSLPFRQRSKSQVVSLDLYLLDERGHRFIQRRLRHGTFGGIGKIEGEAVRLDSVEALRVLK